MTVEITPNGTYGVKMPPLPIIKIVVPLITKLKRLFGVKMLTLITVGARSGRTHEVDLGWYPDKNNCWLVVAATAGAAKHPSWYFNLAHNPDSVWIKVDGRKVKVQAESLKSDERDSKFKEIVAITPEIGKYQTKTDRILPVIRLTAESE